MKINHQWRERKLPRSRIITITIFTFTFTYLDWRRTTEQWRRLAKRTESHEQQFQQTSLALSLASPFPTPDRSLEVHYSHDQTTTIVAVTALASRTGPKASSIRRRIGSSSLIGTFSFPFSVKFSFSMRRSEEHGRG